MVTLNLFNVIIIVKIVGNMALMFEIKHWNFHWSQGHFPTEIDTKSRIRSLNSFLLYYSNSGLPNLQKMLVYLAPLLNSYFKGSKSLFVQGPAQMTKDLEIKVFPFFKSTLTEFWLSGTIWSIGQLSIIRPPLALNIFWIE